MTTITQTITNNEPNINKFIDIHSHILFDVDDGSKDLKQSIEMLNNAKSIGLTNIICTPHINFKEISCKKDIINENMKVLSKEAKKLGINLYFGNEVLLTNETYDMILDKSIYTLNNTKYVLVEFKRTEKLDMKRVLSSLEDIIDIGYIPILAHPELYHNYRKLKYVKELKKKGILLQIDATSILKKGNKRRIYRFARKLLKKELVDFAASDSHGTIKRNYLTFNEAYEKAYKKYNKEYIHTIFYENPLVLLGGKNEKI